MAHNVSRRNYVAATAIAAFRIAAHAATDGEVALATAASAPLMGVNDSVAPEAGERVDIVKSGLADIEYGGTVAKGDPLTSDAQGRAVAASTAGTRIIGFAEVAGVLGDIGLVDIAPGFSA